MNKPLVKTAMAVVLMGGMSAVHAGAEVGQWTIGAGGMWTETDSDRLVDDDFGIYYSLGLVLSEKWDFSVNAFSGNHDDLAPGATWDREIKGLTLDFARVFDRDQRVSPYLLMGVGVLDQRRLTSADKEVAAKLGVGATADLMRFGESGKLQLKGDVSARASIGRGIVDTVATLGLQLALGSVAAPPPPPPPPPPPQAAAPPPPP
ncbi:MAG: porin family protein, partial [Pseudomonadota bacterium]|nr:porin family protein [Pseudomonadota bacterium]